ncbi:unnamed protein product [Caenorhabditis bovis]|uniref:Uncharacterized protein n=1 Tax=Caenorhabditis bovis TaxID=2654633 RepID=A0A8S1EPK8_9PELO|nr:unnamed protein product [Caenorhabditis bovis]
MINIQTISSIFLIFYNINKTLSCPPQPNGNCYYGQYQLSTMSGGFQNQACGTAINRDWCTVSYMPATQQANFGCASNFPIRIGGAICGDGPGFINSQGCSMVNTENGPCYFCCCKGGSCNHPQVFAREASKLPINQIPTYQGSSNGQSAPNYYPIPWYNTSAKTANPLFVVVIVLLILAVISYSQ